MARVFVTSDDEIARIEILSETTDDGENVYLAYCPSCDGNLVTGTHEQWNFEDTVQVAENHVNAFHEVVR